MVLVADGLEPSEVPMPRTLPLPVAVKHIRTQTSRGKTAVVRPVYQNSEIGDKDDDYAALIRGRITPSGMEQNPEGGRHEVGRQIGS